MLNNNIGLLDLVYRCKVSLEFVLLSKQLTIYHGKKNGFCEFNPATLSHYPWAFLIVITTASCAGNYIYLNLKNKSVGIIGRQRVSISSIWNLPLIIVAPITFFIIFSRKVWFLRTFVACRDSERVVLVSLLSISISAWHSSRPMYWKIWLDKLTDWFINLNIDSIDDITLWS